MSVLKSLFGDNNSRYLKSVASLVAKINALEPTFESLSAEALKAKTSDFKGRLAGGESLDDLLPEAFAAVREASKRTLGERHYDVQLIGGIILHQGKISEMKTGEGKSLMATLAAYLNALAGRGVHVVTVNDYLARRDAVWMAQIYEALGLSVGIINHEASYLYDSSHTQAEADKRRDAEGAFRVVYDFLKPCARRDAYLADITYGTNNEYGFDYLRDNLAQAPEGVVQLSLPTRPRHHFAIIDEVDSILIDEARTPLIISAPIGESESLYGTFASLVRQLNTPDDYTIEEKSKSIALTEQGINKTEKALGVENIYTDRGIKYVHHLETAVRAKAIYERDRDYVVKDGEVIIVDEFTGRLQSGRRWSEGLHQAIEAKEGVAVKQESRTFASITFQNYFKLYGKVAGMTGTALTSAEEFERVYGLDTIAVPTHRPNARQDLNDLIFQTEKGKLQAAAAKIKELHQRGQPVLVGTISIEKNELVSAYLKKEGIPHQILNAKNNEEEGAIIAAAGGRGSVVIATNLAGRGVDIKLGGINATPEEATVVKELGGLFVLGTERHEARRIDNQLRGRAGRQGDPGTTQFLVSFDDDLARIFAPDKIKGLMGRLGIPESEAIENRLVSRAIESAQEKIEGLNFDARKHLLDYDNVLNHQRTTIYGKRQAILFNEAEAAADFLDEAIMAVAETPEARETLEKMSDGKEAALGSEAFQTALRQLILQVIDLYWVDHLEMMEYMKGSVRLRAYGQRDPLIEYKREGLAMFKTMERSMFEEVIKLLPNLGINLKAEAPVPLREIHESVQLIGQSANQPANLPAAGSAAGDLGRNEPCPCGSGKKYKKCGLLNTPEHQQLMALKKA